MRKKMIAGNWKMHGTQQSAHELLQSISNLADSVPNVELAVFPPFVHIPECVNFAMCYGAQTVSEYSDGAYTGDVSASMLKNLGCHYVIVGHSERRQFFSENNQMIAKKCIAAVNAGLTPILCVGETLSEREKESTLSVVQEQLEVVSILKDNCTAFANIVIAYEPVWAIGTGKTATPEQAQIVHAFIREQLSKVDVSLSSKTRILYGGSVKPENANALFQMKDIDGALVGGASLNAKSFIEIAKQITDHGNG